MNDLTLVGYLVAAALFIFGLKGLAKPRTAVRGNLLGSAGMLIAIVSTLVGQEILSFRLLAIALVLGALIGTALAFRVAMTAMPQLVALFNGFGGGASVLVGASWFYQALERDEFTTDSSVATALALAIGSITFTGSIVAFAKLQELLPGQAITDPTLSMFNVGVVSLMAILGVGLVAAPDRFWLVALVGIGLIAGVSLVVRIGGADMPVVVALLNSLSGLAASTTGFVLGNPLLIIAGALVGASGLVLTQVMCKAMNRTLFNVVFSTMAPIGPVADAEAVYDGKVTASSAEEVAMILENAKRVAIVPGYGLAVAQAQHAVRDLARSLESEGIEVLFAIHPVAGRMPGHMNVLLAEAEVPYESLLDMDQINPTFDQTDVAIVIGANDVVNPDARENPQSAIAGMPILNADRATTVVVIKRSLSPGFAGIPNPLFAADNTVMLFGDGKAVVEDITRALANA